MIFNPNYTWPQWVPQMLWTIIYFIGAYAGAMEVDNLAMFSWKAVAAGVAAIIVYNHGKMT